MKVEIAATIGAPPEPIWQALIRPSELNQWFGSEIQIDARVGKPHRMVLPFGEPIAVTGRVVAWVPEVRLSYSMVGTPWGVDTTVTYFLSSLEGGRTRLTVYHDGFKKLPAKKRADVVAEVEQFWVAALERLQAHMGLPVDTPAVAALA